MSTRINIQEKLMVLHLNCSFSFGRVTDKQITGETNANKNTKALLVRKELLPGESGIKLKVLQSILASFYQYAMKVTMNSVNRGERLLPVVFYLDFMHEYSLYKTKVNDAFREFAVDYPNAQKLAEDLLNGAYNANDYPDQYDLAEYLKFKVKTLPLPVADTLLKAVGESVQVDVDGYMNEAVEAAMGDINQRFKDGLQRMVTQLSDPKKKVYDSMTESLAELVGLVPSFNVVDDDSLNLLAEEVRQKLLCVGSDALRNDVEKRAATANAAMDILRRMG